MRRIAFWIWLLFCVGLFVFPVRREVFADIIYESPNVSILATDGSTFQIQGEDVYIKAGDCGYFGLYSDMGTISAEHTDEPLGVNECKQYFILKNRQIDVGTWHVASGSPELILSSTHPLKVSLRYPASTKLAVSLLALLVEGLVFVVVSFLGGLIIPIGMPRWYQRRKQYSSQSSR